jgi:hypothetical protein
MVSVLLVFPSLAVLAMGITPNAPCELRRVPSHRRTPPDMGVQSQGRTLRPQWKPPVLLQRRG